ncbi:hypothetical protein [Algoriphagus halophilus]|uniref:hypothetical protein n=1 Tax=Algoriphagus halophilus TaxID=226505 RepID=UPI00358ECE04
MKKSLLLLVILAVTGLGLKAQTSEKLIHTAQDFLSSLDPDQKAKSCSPWKIP